MSLNEYLRVDYTENLREGRGPIPPGMGRGYNFEPDMFWPMRSFLSHEGLELMRKKAAFLLDGAGIRKDFKMAQSGGTPRNMRVVPGTAIQEDEEIMRLYRHPELLTFLGGIVGTEVQVYPDPLENVVITSLERSGDTHGQHLDAPPLALIMCLEAPPLDDPAALVDVEDAEGEIWQSISGTDNPAGMLAFTNVHGDPQLHAMESGDAYLLRSDVLPHQVLPLSDESHRKTIINFTYAIADLARQPDGSAEALFT